jgi:hypothetical protein
LLPQVYQEQTLDQILLLIWISFLKSLVICFLDRNAWKKKVHITGKVWSARPCMPTHERLNINPLKKK